MNVRPNILLITADQARSDAFGCNGNSFVRTPHLDALAARGVTFTSAFTPAPACVPARAAITTGNYAHTCTGLKSNGGRIRDDQVKIAEHFQRAGYGTLAVGKLHYTPYSPPGQPRLLHGFQKAELFEEGRILHQFAPRQDVRGLEDYHDFLQDSGWGGYERAHAIGNNDVHAGPSPLPPELHEEAWVADRTVAMLREHLAAQPGHPFFMWSSFSKPHAPYDPPQPFDRLYDPRSLPGPIGSVDLLRDRDPWLRSWPVAYGWNLMSPQAVRYARALYFGLVTFQDEMIGRILACLRAAGQLDNTLILYTADHGDLLGDFGCFFKANMFQGSVGVPFICAGPGVLARRTALPHLCGLQDILPTLADLTACPLDRDVQGVSLKPVLTRPLHGNVRDFYVSEYSDSPSQRYMVRSPRWKYVYHELGGVEELYDAVEDPQELRNLAQDKPAVVAEWRTVLTDWCRQTGDLGAFGTDGALKQSPEDAKSATAFQAKNMGWRWY